MYQKKLTIILFIIIIILSVGLTIVTNKLNIMTEKYNTMVENSKEQEVLIDKNKEEDDNSNSDKFYNNLETVVNDNTSDINGLSSKDNKLVRETVLKFLQGYANYLDKDNLSFDNRMKSRIYDFKDIMMPDIYENTRLVVEGNKTALNYL